MSDAMFVMGCCAAVRGRFLQKILPVPVGTYSHDCWIVNLADGLKRRVSRENIAVLPKAWQKCFDIYNE